MASRYIKRGSTSNPEVNAWGAAAMLIKSRFGTTYQCRSGYQCRWSYRARKAKEDKRGAVVAGFPAYKYTTTVLSDARGQRFQVVAISVDNASPVDDSHAPLVIDEADASAAMTKFYDTIN